MKDCSGPRIVLVHSILSRLSQPIAPCAHERFIVDDVIFRVHSVFFVINIILGDDLNVVFDVVL